MLTVLTHITGLKHNKRKAVNLTEKEVSLVSKILFVDPKLLNIPIQKSE